ncbi:MAG: zinc transporter ZupT [Clostridiaceae bacterium]|nr:zinc transporter ZupT [Clostridiaceae bacterium]
MKIEPSAYAIILSLLAGISTGIGGLTVLFFKKTSPKHLSVLLGFSAGIMIFLSFMEIYREAENYLCNSHGIRNGKILTILSFFFGITLMAFINEFIPEPNRPHSVNRSSLPSSSNLYSKSEQSFISDIHKPNIKTVYYQNTGPGKLLKTGLFTAIAVTIHNFPEGIATYVSGIKSPALGLSIAIAIALHNIPEGIAISVPIYYSTKSKAKAFFASCLSGLSEPLGAIITMLVLGRYITDATFGLIFGCVAGIMVYISLDELLPTAREYGYHGLALLGLMLGMALMAISSVFIF